MALMLNDLTKKNDEMTTLIEELERRLLIKSGGEKFSRSC